MSLGRFRLFPRRMGQHIRAWPMLALLLLIVLGAIGCVLWFMRAAMENERFAVRQKLTDAYRGQLTTASRPNLRSGLRSRERNMFPRLVGNRSFSLDGFQCAQISS